MLRRRPRLSFLVILLVGGAVAFIVVWPPAIGIHRLPFIANLLSLRGVLALALGVLALLVGGFAVRRKAWGVSAALALALAAASLGIGAGWRAESATVLTDFDGAGSDHRPIVATLTRR